MVYLSRHDAGFYLGGPVATVAQSLQRVVQINHKVDIDAGIGRQRLTKTKNPGFAPKVSFIQKFQRLLFTVKCVVPGVQTVNRIGYQIDIV